MPRHAVQVPRPEDQTLGAVRASRGRVEPERDCRNLQCLSQLCAELACWPLRPHSSAQRKPDGQAQYYFRTVYSSQLQKGQTPKDEGANFLNY